MRFKIEYQGKGLVEAYEQQFARGGVLVPGDPPAGVTLFQPAELELVSDGQSVVLAAQVVQAFAGVGVALTVDAKDKKLIALVERVRSGKPAVAAAAAAPARPAGPAAGAAAAEKIQQALHGNRDERAAILRETNRSLHLYVLRNPGLGTDEVASMARMSTLAAEIFKQIVERREWVSRPDIAIALVRNHAVPVPLALRALEHVSSTDLRALAKDTRAREPIVRAARKKVIAP